MKTTKRLLALFVCITVLCTMCTAFPVYAQTETVELLLNGGFEQADEYGFPLYWDSEGKNLIPKGDFEGNNLSAGYALDGKTAVNYNTAGGGESAVSVVSNGADAPETVGNYSLKIQWKTAKWGGSQVRNDTYGLVPVALGSEYTARAMVKAGDNTHFPAAENKFQFCFMGNYKNTSTGKSDFFVDDNSWIPTTTWQEFSKNFTFWTKDEVTAKSTMANGAFLERYQVRSRTAAVADAVLFVDNFRMEKISRTSTASVASGEKSLMIKGYADGQTEEWTSDYAAAYSGQPVAISAKVNVESIASYTYGSKTVNPEVAVIAEFDNGTSVKLASYASATDGFVSVNQNVTVPGDAAYVRLKLTVDGDGVAYFDDASICAEAEAPSVDVTAYVNKIANNGFETTDSYAFPVNWDSDGKNLIPNGDFENNSLSAGYARDGKTAVKYGAAGGGESAVSVVSNGADAPEAVGDYSLKIEWDEVKWGGSQVRNDNYGLVPVEYGAEYVARAMVKAGDNTHFTSAANRFQFGFIGNYVNNSTKKNEFLVDDNSWIPTTTWQEFSKTFSIWNEEDVTPKDTVVNGVFLERYQVRSRTAAVADAVLYVDNFSMEKVSRSDTTEKNTGDKSLKIVAYDDGIDEVWTSDKVSVQEGSEIAVGAAYKALNSDTGLTVKVIYFNGSNKVREYVVAKDANSDSWENIAKLTTVPAGADSAQIELTVPGNVGTVWVDDVLLGVLPSDMYVEGVRYSHPDVYGNNGETITVSVDITNPKEQTTLFVASVLYDGSDNMIVIDAKTETIPAETEGYTVTRKVLLPETGDLSNYHITTMVWESTSSLKPLCESFFFP